MARLEPQRFEPGADHRGAAMFPSREHSDEPKMGGQGSRVTRDAVANDKVQTRRNRAAKQERESSLSVTYDDTRDRSV